MAKYLYIDGNNIGHASQRTNKLHVAGREVQAIFHFMKSIRSLLVENKGFIPLVLWDGKAKHRIDLYPEYKGNRGKDPKQKAEADTYREQLPDIQKMLSLLGVRQLVTTNLEADDLAGFLSVKASAEGHQVKLISGDKDWIQLVNENCYWHDPIRDETVTSSNFAEKTGFASPNEFVQGKALQGDSSDNIGGVGGIGEKGAMDFLFEYGSVENFIKMAKKGLLSEKLPTSHQRLLDNKPFFYRKKEYQPMIKTFIRNVKLMELRKVEKPDPKKTKNFPAKLDQFAFEEMASELAFNSILKTVDVWILPFKRQL